MDETSRHSVVIPVTADGRLVTAGDLSELCSSASSYAPWQLKRLHLKCGECQGWRGVESLPEVTQVFWGRGRICVWARQPPESTLPTTALWYCTRYRHWDFKNNLFLAVFGKIYSWTTAVVILAKATSFFQSPIHFIIQV